MVWALIIIEITLAFIYSLFLEWAIHKYILHNIGRRRKSILSFHFFEHHGASRRSNFEDPAYKNISLAMKGGSGKELLSLVLLLLMHIPIIFFYPFAFATLGLCIVHYFVIHIASHKSSEWARKWLPWHYDHHMARNQDFNWGVRFDWIDRLMGTRRYYVGTNAEKRDIMRRIARKEKNRLRALEK